MTTAAPSPTKPSKPSKLARILCGQLRTKPLNKFQTRLIEFFFTQPDVKAEDVVALSNAALRRVLRIKQHAEWTAPTFATVDVYQGPSHVDKVHISYAAYCSLMGMKPHDVEYWYKLSRRIRPFFIKGKGDPYPKTPTIENPEPELWLDQAAPQAKGYCVPPQLSEVSEFSVAAHNNWQAKKRSQPVPAITRFRTICSTWGDPRVLWEELEADPTSNLRDTARDCLTRKAERPITFDQHTARASYLPSLPPQFVADFTSAGQFNYRQPLDMATRDHSPINDVSHQVRVRNYGRMAEGLRDGRRVLLAGMLDREATRLQRVAEFAGDVEADEPFAVRWHKAAWLQSFLEEPLVKISVLKPPVSSPLNKPRPFLRLLFQLKDNWQPASYPVVCESLAEPPSPRSTRKGQVIPFAGEVAGRTTPWGEGCLAYLAKKEDAATLPLMKGRFALRKFYSKLASTHTGRNGFHPGVVITKFFALFPETPSGRCIHGFDGGACDHCTPREVVYTQSRRAKCTHLTNSFTFTDACTITLCPQCGETTGHDVLLVENISRASAGFVTLWDSILKSMNLSANRAALPKSWFKELSYFAEQESTRTGRVNTDGVVGGEGDRDDGVSKDRSSCDWRERDVYSAEQKAVPETRTSCLWCFDEFWARKGTDFCPDTNHRQQLFDFKTLWKQRLNKKTHKHARHLLTSVEDNNERNDNTP